VGADAGGLKDVITPEVDGYRFAPGSSEELARCVLSLLADESLRQRMGASARQKAEGFSQTKISKQWMDLYSSLLAGGGQRPTSP
jgi:phosphatidylinositol alpha 1,6-mannosyltransferase